MSALDEIRPAGPELRGARYVWCHTCRARDRLVIGGECVVCGHDPDTRPCVICLTPTTRGRWCSENCHRSDEPWAYDWPDADGEALEAWDLADDGDEGPF